ncbi:MAG: HDOD domain-containing protein [Betaproteobacteria bacterium]|nr:HDOD domain-containing protein [Betaproteobacteria bacterium]
MSTDRREHVRYEAKEALPGLLIWQDESGNRHAPAQMRDISQGGCALYAVDAPLVGALALIRLALPGHAEPVAFQCRIVSRNPRDDTLLVSLKFEQLSELLVALLQAALTSEAFQPARSESPQQIRKHWRVPQWAAYLTAQQLPVMPRSKTALQALETEKGAEISANDLVKLVNADPFLCLCLLREAEKRRSTRLGHETSTPLAAVMQLGVAGFRELLLTSPETDESNPGLAKCENRAVIAGELAAAWSASRSDVSPEEVLMAALLSEMGELLLWHFASDLPQAALATLASGEAKRTAAAQEASCGFKFKDLTLKCAEIWKLPAILMQLIHGHDTVRANIARLCRDTARHLTAGPDNPALPDDLAAAQKLIPHASMEWLAGELKWVPEEMRQDLIDKANQAFRRIEHDAT